MEREDFVKTFLEGAMFTPKDKMLEIVVGMLHDERWNVRGLQDRIAYMDELARDSGVLIRCRGCNELYELPCELSEMSHEGNYCNSGHGGAYHCAP